MRLAALLVAIVPAYALAQSAPPAPAPAKPVAPTLAKPVPHPPAKPAPPPPAKPGQKPAAPDKKHAPPKPAPHKPKPPAPRPAPAVVPVPVPVDPPAPEEAKKGSATGQPIPRFAALRSDDVNFRIGPGTRFQVEWVYKRRDLPVLIEREFEIWRQIRDPDGNKGWVHQATLSGRRTAVVIGAEHVLRQAGDDAAGPVAKLKPGVILRLRSCEANSMWCQAQIGDYRGYIKRSEIWGILPDEVIQ